MLLALLLPLLLGGLPARAGVEATRLPGWSAWRWTDEDGLPLDAVTGVAIDRDGLAWISTFDGLARFDGDRFVVYRPATHPGLPSARFVSVATDPGGRPWALTESKELVRWTPDGFAAAPTESLGIGAINALVPGPDALWLRGGGGLARVAADGTSATPWPEVADPDRIRAVHGSPEGLLVSAVSGKIFAVDAETGAGTPLGRASRLPEVPSRPRFGSAAPEQVVRTPTGFAAVVAQTLWVDGPEEERRAIPLPGSDGRVFVTEAGAVRVRTPAGDLELVGDTLVPLEGGLGVPPDTWWVAKERLYRGDQLVLEGQRPLALLAEDARGGAWVGEKGRGLLHVRASPVTSLQEDAHGRLGPLSAVMFDRDGALWLAGASGLRRLSDGRTDRAVDAHGAVVTDAVSLLQTSTGALWVTLADGACVVDEPASPGPPVCADRAPGRERRNHVVQLQTRDGAIWAGSDHVVRTTPDGAVSAFAKTEGWRPIRALLELQDGSLLASGIGSGLFHIRGDTEARRAGAPGSPLRTVRAMLLDERGDVWLGTEGNGLCRLQLSTAASVTEAPLRCLGPDEGVTDPFISSLTSDGRGRLWMSSNRGLHAVRWEALQATMEGRQERVPMVSLARHAGMAEPETNGTSKPSAAVAPDGAIWYPTMDGAARLDPSAVAYPEPPPVVVDALASPTQTWAEPPDVLTLEEGARELTVAWTAAAFEDPGGLRFRYRLAGLDADWRGPTAARTATWTTLPPGTYTLELQSGWAGEGDWAAPQAVAVVSVPPVFTETRWFWLLLASAGAGLVGVLVWGRFRQARARQAQLEQAVEAATTQLARRNQRLVEQSAELTRQRKALAEQAHALEEQNAHIAGQADTLARRNARIAAQAARLEQLDQVRTRFVANISHELRTPLTLIRGTLSDVAEDAPAPLRRPLGVARRNAERLGELVEQLLDVARLDAGGVPLRARRVELSGFLAQVSARFEGAAQARGVTLRRVTDGPVEVWLDPELMEKVLTNLIANALDYTPPGGWIEVGLSTTGDADFGLATVCVTDTGPGVPEPLRERLFDRFFQADDGDRRERGGAGIGLALAREIVELHGGEIGVDNAEGAGARFSVTLPLGVAHLSPGEVDLSPPAEEPVAGRAEAGPCPAPDPAEAPGDDDGPSVALVVEDHPDMRAYIQQHLSAALSVVTAPDGQDALERLRGGLRPDVIVSDVMMPRLDGLSLCRAIRDDPALVGLPILLVSAKATESDRMEGLSLADDYLTKPFRAAEMVQRACNLAARGRARAAAAVGPAAAAPDPSAPPEDPFLAKLEAVALPQLADTGFGATQLARAAALSPRQLLRRVREASGLTASAWLRELRLRAAQDQMRRGAVETVAEAAAAVGFSPAYLSRMYAEWAGHPPSEDLAGR